MDSAPDTAVGSILVNVFDSDPESKEIEEPDDYYEYFFPTVPLKKVPFPTTKEKYLVFSGSSSQNRPYYITQSNNRVYVIDTARITFFEEKEAIPSEVVQDVEEENEEAINESSKSDEEDPVPVGTIIIQVPRKEENGSWVFSFETREVLMSKNDSSNENPLFFYFVGKRTLYVDQRKIRFYPPTDSPS